MPMYRLLLATCPRNGSSVLTTPLVMVSVSSFAQPPIFSARPFVKRILSASTYLPSCE